MSRVMDTAGTVSKRVPQSASYFSVNVLGLCAGLFVLWALRDASFAYVLRGCFAALAIFVTIGGYELFVAHVSFRASTGLSANALRSVSLRRVSIRLFSLAVVILGIGATYWMLSEYHGKFYQPFWQVLETFGPWLVVCAPFYFMWMDTRQRDSHDAYLQLGRWLLKREAPAQWNGVREMLLGWVVKAYFLPLMMVYFSGMVESLINSKLSFSNGLDLFTYVSNLGFMIDMLFAIVGYICTIRLFDSHVRTVEPTAFGWVIALICYQPFFSVMNSAYLTYQGTLHWDNALIGLPVLRFVWGIAILALIVLYGLSTCAFGLRFSNLTNRGIITSGPYRWTKHPAYITKCLSFWMISVPFIEPLGWQLAVRHCVALTLICVIYFLRARTEERHLMRVPEYREYAAWIAQHGLYAKFKGLFA